MNALFRVSKDHSKTLKFLEAITRKKFRITRRQMSNGRLKKTFKLIVKMHPNSLELAIISKGHFFQFPCIYDCVTAIQLCLRKRFSFSNKWCLMS